MRGAKTRIAWVADAGDRLSRLTDPAVVARDLAESVSLPDGRVSTQQPALNVATVVSSAVAATESFRLVFPRGTGRIELPTDLRESELALITAQLDAIMSLLKARIAISKMMGVDVTS